jgi:hypothetical protein
MATFPTTHKKKVMPLCGFLYTRPTQRKLLLGYQINDYARGKGEIGKKNPRYLLLHRKTPIDVLDRQTGTTSCGAKIALN